ncbi:hypothetical protein CRUP_032641, partial [Coryphaenoides rupestris]
MRVKPPGSITLVEVLRSVPLVEEEELPCQGAGRLPSASDTWYVRSVSSKPVALMRWSEDGSERGGESGELRQVWIRAFPVSLVIMGCSFLVAKANILPVEATLPGKKTRGRVKIKMEFIDNKLRRYTTFSKRKTGIMKKAYELSTLTGTQVLLLVASETGHVYTFATRKLQPMITSDTGKALIQTCLNSPDSPPRSDPSSDQRMSATGFEETDLTYQVSEAEGCAEVTK